jgi:hypothetical protein
MSDEQQRRDGAARGGSEPDETREFDPLIDDETQPDGRPRSSDAWVLDRTEQMPGAPAGGDETVVTPRPDATSVMPPVGRDPGRAGAAAGAAAANNDAWLGRAEVRPPLPGQGGNLTGGDWETMPAPGEPRGRWWMPIVIGIAILLLLALLGWGTWLILQNAGDDSPTPAVTATATVPEATEATTTPPMTTPPTTEPTGPTEVTVPALIGLSSAEARQALDRRGLGYRLRFVTSSDAPAGTVIDSDPAEGQQVPSDTKVTLIIASAPSTAATTTTPATTVPTDPNGNEDQPDED